jgi:transposase-like protein
VPDHRVSEVANRLGVSKWSRAQWLRAYRGPQSESARLAGGSTAESRRLRADLKRVTEERYIRRMAAAHFAEQSG